MLGASETSRAAEDEEDEDEGDEEDEDVHEGHQGLGSEPAAAAMLNTRVALSTFFLNSRFV